MGGFHLKFSDESTSNQMRVNFLAIQFGWARWRHEVVRVVMCCETRGRRGKLPGLWYYFCTETIGRKGVLLTSRGTHKPRNCPARQSQTCFPLDTDFTPKGGTAASENCHLLS